MKCSRIFRVVIAMKMQSHAAQQTLAGIFRFLSSKYLWDLTLLRSEKELSADFINKTSRDTDGYLISLHEPAEIRQTLIRSGKPIIFLDDIKLDSIAQNRNASFLDTNQEAIGTSAARHLLAQAQFETYAFVHAIGRPHWSCRREDGFVRTLAKKQKPVIVYADDPTSSDEEHLAQWIEGLPKPTAIFAAFDDRAVDIVNCCRSRGIKIPQDVAILGAGNDELICNSCRPTVSSVQIPFESYGFLAARELQARMMLPNNRKAISAPTDFTIIDRQTTSEKSSVNAIVHDGLAFISTYATSGIKVPDVVRHLNVSRRLADLRFQQATGKSILQTIITSKTDAAKRLLKITSLSIAEIAPRCGFANPNYFKNVFVRTVGTSPRAWRKAQQQQAK